MQLFFRFSILLSVVFKRWNFPENLDFKGKVMAKFADFYTIRVYSEKCFRTGYNSNSNYNFMQWCDIEIRGDHRRGKIIFI